MKTLTPFSSFDLQQLLTGLSGREFAFFETTRFTDEDQCSLLFVDPVEHLTCTAGQQPEQFLQKAQEKLDQGYHLAGWFAYEFGYLLEPVLSVRFRPQPETVVAHLAVFEAPAVFDHQLGKLISGQWPSSSTQAEIQENDSVISNLHFSQDKMEYLEKIHRIKEYIAAGDTYQVNYTLKLLFDFAGSPDELYQRLRRNQSVSYSAYLTFGGRRVLSFSPELFFRKEGSRCTVRPMKGTSRRGRTLAEDEAIAGCLGRDIKNRSENVMIVDLLRNDLGRMGRVSVSSLFDVETYETLHQMTSTIVGEIPSSIPLIDLFRALFPCGSVTGAPKIHTMEIIHELESAPRGIYTGAIGYIRPDGDCCFNVPIRTVVLEGNRGEMGIGSGIISDSDPGQEWRECKLKGHFLTNPLPDFQLIETILWQPGQGFWLLDFHLDRLLNSARYFFFRVGREQVRQTLRNQEEIFSGKTPQRVRLLLHKDGRLELSATPCSAPRNTFFQDDIPTVDLPLIRFSGKKTDSRQISLFHKTTMRELYNTERTKAVDGGCFEVIFCNKQEEVTEGSITNIFIRKGQMFFTPPIECGLLGGVMRRFLLEKNGERVREKVLHEHDLLEADGIYAVNSVRGVVQVRLEQNPGDGKQEST